MNWDSFLGAVSAVLLWTILDLLQAWWWNPRHLGPHILKAEPRIRRVLEITDTHEGTNEELSRAVTAALAGVDHTAVVIKMAATMNMMTKWPDPMTRAELLEMFMPSDEELRERGEL
jgi:hypothetical protein